VQLYINSPGGSITAGLAIYDTMQFIKNNVVTYCIGQAASMEHFFCCGTKANACPANSRILIHQPSMAPQRAGHGHRHSCARDSTHS